MMTTGIVPICLVLVTAGIVGCDGPNGGHDPVPQVPGDAGVTTAALISARSGGLNVTWSECTTSYSVSPGSVIDVTESVWDGADTGADDADRLQTAIDCAMLMADDGGAGRAVVEFGAATWSIGRPLEVGPGLTLMGHGTTLELTGSASGAFTTTGHTYAGSGDSLPLNIYGFDIDGSGTSSTQADALHLAGTSAVRLVVALRGLTLHDFSGYGLKLNGYVAGRIAGIRVVEAADGALYTSGDNELQISDVVSVTASSEPVSGTDGDITIGGAGTYLIREMHTTRDVTLNLPGAATVLVSDLTAAGELRVVASSADVRIVDSEFGNTHAGSVIQSPYRVTLTRTRFVGAIDALGFRLLQVTLAPEYEVADRELVLDECTFSWAGTSTPSSAPTAVYVTDYNYGNPLDARNRIIMRGSRIEAGPWQYGVRMNGGWLVAQGSTFDGVSTTDAISLSGGGSGTAARRTYAQLDGVRFPSDVGCAIDVANVGDSTLAPQLFLANIDIPATQASSSACGVYSFAEVHGRRILTGATSPGTTSCLVGDVYRLDAPPSSGTYEWLCTLTGATGTWLEYTAL